MHNTSQANPIINVFNYNLREQINLISDLVVQYPIISIVRYIHPSHFIHTNLLGHRISWSYCLSNNKFWRLQLQPTQDECRSPQNHPTWPVTYWRVRKTSRWISRLAIQFPIRHRVIRWSRTDCYSSDSMHLLLDAGIDFEAHKKNGIDPEEFGSVLTSSGIRFTQA